MSYLQTLAQNPEIQKDPTASKYFKRSTRWITTRFFDNIVEEIKDANSTSLLDIGCGTGFISKILHEFQPHIIGTDINYDRLQIANELYGSPSLPFLTSNAFKLPFRDSQFETVTAFEVFEHIPDLEPLVVEVKRVAEKNVIITVPNEPNFRIMNFMRGKNLTRWGNDIEHVHHFNRKKLTKFLSKHFSDVTVRRNSFVWLIAKCEV